MQVPVECKSKLDGSIVHPQIWIFITCSDLCYLQCLENKKTESYYYRKASI